MDKINLPVLFGEKEELNSIEVTPEENKYIANGDYEILQKLINKEMEKRSNAMIQQLVTNQDSEILIIEGNDTDVRVGNTEEAEKSHKDDEKETFTWPEKAVMLFLELYREREHEFTMGLKRHNKLWSEIASELKNSNYIVSGVQVQNKMSSLKRTYKKIKDCNAKSGNHNSTWSYYSVMDSIFGDKGWASPPAVASSDGPIEPDASTYSATLSTHSSSQSSMDNFECQDISLSKPKKRKVETILESFILDVKNNREQLKEERRQERLEKEQKKEQRWEVYRAEKREMHKETSEIQKSLVNLLGKLVEKGNK